MQIELPKELARLDEPNFVLMPPIGVQYGFLSVILLLSLSGLGWLLYSLTSYGSVSAAQIFCGVISFFGIVTSIHRPYWKRWASFACDRNGVYLARPYQGYTFRAWEDVGGAYIGNVTSGDAFYKDVILKVKFSKAEWKEHRGTFTENFVIDEDGFVHYGVGQQCRDVDDTLKEIERIGLLSGKFCITRR